MKESKKLTKYIANIERFEQEKAVWIAKPHYERTVSSRPEDLGCISSIHFSTIFIDNEAREYLSVKEIKPLLKHRFRVKDGDGVVCASGWSSCCCSFAPLDDFFEADAGAVEIEYFESGKWETL